jgi:hypothetical protein
MVYSIESDIILIEVDRTLLVDISAGDVIKSNALSEAEYTWTEQDCQFQESNPDARIFVKFQKSGKAFKGIGVVVVPEAVY